MNLLMIAAVILVSAGAFFLFIGSLGLIRLPDFYSRSHATGKSDTLGVMLVIFGLAFTQGLSINTAKLLMIMGFVAFTNPTATNALAGAALRFRLTPWFRQDKNNREH